MTTAPPQHSPDGRWWWDGERWVPTYAPPPSADGKAIASLVTGLFWMYGLGSIAAVILGHLSRREAKQQNRRPSGLALAGLILGYVGIAGATALTSLFVLTAFGGSATLSAVESGAGVEREARAVAAAEHNHLMAKGTYTSSLTALDDYGYPRDFSYDIDVVSATKTGFCITVVGDGGVTASVDERGAVQRRPCESR